MGDTKGERWEGRTVQTIDSGIITTLPCQVQGATPVIFHARHFATGSAVAVTISNRRIGTVESSVESPTRWLAPAFFDPQINGCLGVGFNSPTLTPDGVRMVADECRRHGIGAFCPTVITDSFDTQRNAFAVLTRSLAADDDLARRMPCFHLEGPYLAGDDGPRGAHPKAHVRDPDWDEFRRLQDAADGRIRMVTLAPERPGAVPFIEQATAAGIVIALGHTAATGEQLRDAVSAGAKTSTHLGNGCHATMNRHANPIWEQAANDSLWASLIADGHHLPPAVVKTLIRAKTVARTLLTCDAGTFAGCAPGRYSDWGTEVEVLPGGKIVVPGTPYLAGSGVFTDACVSNLLRVTDVSLADAIGMASLRPHQLLGLPLPGLEVGDPGPWMLFDWQPGGDLVVTEVVGD